VDVNFLILVNLCGFKYSLEVFRKELPSHFLATIFVDLGNLRYVKLPVLGGFTGQGHVALLVYLQ